MVRVHPADDLAVDQASVHHCPGPNWLGNLCRFLTRWVDPFLFRQEYFAYHRVNSIGPDENITSRFASIREFELYAILRFGIC